MSVRVPRKRERHQAGALFTVIALALFAAWLGEAERRLGYSRAAMVSHLVRRKTCSPPDDEVCRASTRV